MQGSEMNPADVSGSRERLHPLPSLPLGFPSQSRRRTFWVLYAAAWCVAVCLPPPRLSRFVGPFVVSDGRTRFPPLVKSHPYICNSHTRRYLLSFGRHNPGYLASRMCLCIRILVPLIFVFRLYTMSDSSVLSVAFTFMQVVSLTLVVCHRCDYWGPFVADGNPECVNTRQSCRHPRLMKSYGARERSSNPPFRDKQ